MDHIVILGHIVILLVGTWALFSVHQAYQRFHFPFLKFLVYYVVVFNIAVFIYLSQRYAMVVNVIAKDSTITNRPVVTLMVHGATGRGARIDLHTACRSLPGFRVGRTSRR